MYTIRTARKKIHKKKNSISEELDTPRHRGIEINKKAYRVKVPPGFF